MVQSKKLVSVIMPSYNCDQYLAASAKSVLCQSYENLEIIISDDCSSDGTRDVMSELASLDSRVVPLYSPRNRGAALARNDAIRAANGEYLAFLDSDDLWVPNKLEKQISLMEKRHWPISFTSYAKIDEEGRLRAGCERAISECDYRRALHLGNPMGNSTVVFNCETLGKHYAPNIRKRNDFALWLSILKNDVTAHGIDEILTFYRVRNNSLSANKSKLIKHQWYLYRAVEELSPLHSSLLLAEWAARKTAKGFHRFELTDAEKEAAEMSLDELREGGSLANR